MLLYVCAFLVATVVAGRQIPDNERYIILLEKGSDAGDIEELIQSMEVHASSTREEMQVRFLTSLLPFVIGNMSEATAEMVSKLSSVKLVEKNQITDLYDRHYIKRYTPILSIPQTDRYNIDILDNVDCIDGSFSPCNYGKGVDIYFVDTGINYDHIDFGWRDEWSSGTRAVLGYDAVDAKFGTNDEGKDSYYGWGTHNAGIAAGIYSGVAKDANLYSVRVLKTTGAISFGDWEMIIDGLDHVSSMHDEKSARSNFVGSIASILDVQDSQSIAKAAKELWNKGIVTVVKSEDARSDACRYCREMHICVGAHDYNMDTCDKKMMELSNYGPCVDITAPGMNIMSASNTDTFRFAVMDGTQAAYPHVTGVAALMKGANSSLTPDEILHKLKEHGIGDIDRSDKSCGVQAAFHAKRLYVSSQLLE